MAQVTDTAAFHEAVGKAASVELVGKENGNYLFRPEQKGKPGFILTVVFKNHATHHKVQLDTKTQLLSINSKKTNSKTLSQLEKELSRKRPDLKWPAVLLNAIESKQANQNLKGQTEPTTESNSTRTPSQPPATQAVAKRPVDGGDSAPSSGSDAHAKQIQDDSGIAEENDSGWMPQLKKVQQPPQSKNSHMEPSASVDFKKSLKAVGSRSDIKLLDALPPEPKPEWTVESQENDVDDNDAGSGHLIGEFPAFPNAARDSGQEVSVTMGQFYHGNLSEDDAEALILGQQNAKSGTFLFRNDKNDNHYLCSALEVRGKGTSYRVNHHRVSPNKKNSAEFDVNGKPTATTDFIMLAKYLQKMQPGWSTPLTTGVLGYAMVTDVMLEARLADEIKKEEELKRAAAEAQKAEIAAYRKQQEAKSDKLRAAAVAESELAKKRQEDIDNEMAAGRERAKVLVLESKKRELLAKKRKELIAQKSQEFNESIQTLNSALAKAKEMPVDQDGPDVVDSDSDSDGDGPGEVRVWTPIKRSNSFNKSGGTVPPTLHPAIDDLEAYGWLNDGDAQDGKFLVRQIKKQTHKYKLDMIIDGKPVSFNLTQKDSTFFKEFLVDGNPTGTTTIDSLVELLSEPHVPWWPVPLRRDRCVVPRHSRKESQRVRKMQKSMKR